MVRQRRTDYEGYVKPGTTRWTDYDGDEIYGDYVVVVEGQNAHITNTMSYLPGVGQMDPQTGEATYYHGDHLGTLRVLTDQQSAVSGTMVYTAFGEVVCGDESHPCGTGVPPVGTRYQYAGEWGYESGLLPEIPKDPGAPIPGLPWQHVGHRWYDASTGRFLQRDPIGTLGGLNVYAYARSRPVSAVDPRGWATINIFVDGGFVAGVAGSAGMQLVIGWDHTAPGSGWTWDLQCYGGVGTGVGLSAGVTGGVVITGAPTPSALTGPGWQLEFNDGMFTGSVCAGSGYTGSAVGGSAGVGTSLALQHTRTFSLFQSFALFIAGSEQAAVDYINSILPWPLTID
jgi:uncharacterized protein RhaS with RHS repeats